ncbi:MAG: ABC transporter permease subunit [Euryarchaeota archaeon]|jgi:ABC-type transport system involved in multi-copper enzyme maturation permease subunit|nr:ABC transporter permease subunit [Euryarchaeota archaeon]
MISPPKKDNVFRALDRKLGAVAEFTMRQYRTKLSTWVVMGVGFIAIAIIVLFYVDSMQQEIEAIDNDGDSMDWDGDGYPTGQERIYGTDPDNPDSNPGTFSPPIAPDPPEKWINEDDFDWDLSATSDTTAGYDDDGDCRLTDTTESQKDRNRNNVNCDIILDYSEIRGELNDIHSDGFVDEDPDEEKYSKEAIHRAFLLAIGKMGFVFLLGIFLPLFLATGLIREEMENSTMHFMIAKPIARRDIFLGRVVGYLGIVWPYVIAMGIIVGLISGFAGPSDGFFRFADLGMWMAIIFATMMATLVYGMLFCALGTLWKRGIVLALPFAAWELGMAIVSFNAPSASILRFSVIGWSLNIIDAASLIVWPNLGLFIEMGLWGGGHNSNFWGSELEGAGALSVFASDTGLGISPIATIAVSTFVLLFQAIILWVIGSAVFKGKEIE